MGRVNPIDLRMERAQLGWVIDVCATCGALATYPFSCGHRVSDRMWTIPIAVKPTQMARRQLLRPPVDRLWTGDPPV